MLQALSQQPLADHDSTISPVSLLRGQEWAIDHYARADPDRDVEEYSRQAETVYFDRRIRDGPCGDDGKDRQEIEKLPSGANSFSCGIILSARIPTIANKLKIKEQTVRNQITRARNTLRKAFL